MGILPIVLALLAGVTFGALRHGRLRAIARTRVRHPELLGVAIGCSLYIDVSDAGPTGIVAIAGLAGGLGFAACNVHLAGMAVIAVGIAANLLPVAFNGAMPVRPDALVEAEMVMPDELDRVRLSGARELQTDDTILPFFGDTYPLRWTGQVLSLGDLIMMVGLADVVANLMLQRRRRRLPPSAVPSLGAMGWHEDDDIVDLMSRERSIDLRSHAPVDLRGEAQPVADPASASSSARPVHD